MSIAYGHGLVSKSKSGAILDAHFKVLGLGKLSSSSAPDLASLASVDEIRGVRREPIAIEIDLGIAPKDVPDAYLRLHFFRTEPSSRMRQSSMASLEYSIM